MEIVQSILALVGGISSVVLAVVCFAYWLFKLFSDKWLTAKFAERLADYKHAQQKELEDVRFEINKLMDRTVKLHQLEYEALPQVWSRAADAHGLAMGVLTTVQQYPDLERLNEAQLDELLENSPLTQSEIVELKSSQDKNKCYQQSITWHRWFEARKAAQEFHQYLLKYGIFIVPEIHEKLKYVKDLIWEAIVEAQLRLQEPDEFGLVMEKLKKFDDEGKYKMNELVIIIRNRLSS